jgi:hypothetical protein
MDPLLCLLPSPLLGPSCWRPVADLLRGRGLAVTIAAPRSPRTAADAVTTYLAAIPPDRSVVLIPHSNAGLFIPSLAAQRRVAGFVFVDAGLPGAVDHVPMIPAEFYEMLAGKADSSGLLPPWTQWWDGEDLSGLFPDARTRELVESEQQRLPLSYFRESVPVPAGWPSEPGAYLAFGDTYAAERATADAWGWPVTTLRGAHLHMLVDPGSVAVTITDLIAKLGGLAAARAPRRMNGPYIRL